VLTASAQSFTQEVISNGGGNYTQINGSLEFNIGEVITETYSNNYGIFYAGFEQGFYGILSVDEINNENSVFNLYPNPTNGKTNLTVSSKYLINSNCVLTDIFGKRILEFTLDFNTVFDLSDCSTGVYFLNISANNNLIKTFKIIKNE
jgi:hypothetical protein